MSLVDPVGQEDECDSDTGLLAISETEDLCNISYSRDATVTAFKEYFQFLTQMYLDPEHVVYPPDDGWPEITTASMQGFHKTDEVVDLLRHLPDVVNDTGREVHAAGHCEFVGWSSIAKRVHGSPEGTWDNGTQPDHWLVQTQGVWDSIPPHVVGFVKSRHYKMFLDTKLGIISFIGGDFPPGPRVGAARPDAPYQAVRDDPIDYAPEEEYEWRSAGAAWAIGEFFAMLKYHFQQLHYLPVSDRKVEELFGEPAQSGDAWGENLKSVQEVYRRYGWPDLEVYQKDACLKAVAAEVQERERSDPNVIFAA